MEVINTLGRRKTAVARIYMQKGNGKITVNKKDYKEYFPTGTLQYIVNQSLEATKSAGQYDLKVNVVRGGTKGQAEAVKLGIARALLQVNAEFRPSLKAAGLLKRDPRAVERKKPGRKKARKSFQFSKR